MSKNKRTRKNNAPEKPGSADVDPRAKEWFAAALKYNWDRMREIFDDGIDIDCRDQRGRTALFYAVSPWGGCQELVGWLVHNGADVNVRDKAGQTALEFGRNSVSSALEASMMAWAEDLFCRHGYPERPKPRPPNPRDIVKRKLSDFWGNWTIDGGDDDGHVVRISSLRIESDIRWLRLEVDEAVLDEKGRLKLHGDHATEIVHVTIAFRGPGRATLRWSDEIMGPLPAVRLKRK